MSPVVVAVAASLAAALPARQRAPGRRLGRCPTPATSPAVPAPPAPPARGAVVDLGAAARRARRAAWLPRLSVALRWRRLGGDGGQAALARDGEVWIWLAWDLDAGREVR